MTLDRADRVTASGLGLIVAGVALWSLPLSVIIAGVFVTAAGLLIGRTAQSQPQPPKEA